MTDLAPLRVQLSAYLAARGIPVQDDTLACPNPAHADPETPAVLESGGPDQTPTRVTCATCGASWDVFSVAALLDHIEDTAATFAERVHSVSACLAAARRVKPTAQMTDAEWAEAKRRVKGSGSNGQSGEQQNTRGVKPQSYDYIEPPFRILGVDGDRGWYIGRSDTVVALDLASLGKTRIMQLAPIDWWTSNFEGNKGRLDQDLAVDWLIHKTRERQFSSTCLRGRGAWRDRDPEGGVDRVVFHDGEHTVGEVDAAHVYQRKAGLGILPMGLQRQPADAEARAAMREAARGLAFATEADMGRLMAWAAIAPFCGALPWRPAGMITGESGSGKSTILTYIVKPLVATPHYFTAGTGGTTEAGIRQDVGNDALPVILEESETHSESDRARVQGIFALMRQSVMDGAPRIAKGTPTGKGIQFETRCMFLFAAITQGAEYAADAKRMFVVDLGNADGHWPTLRARVLAAFTPDACAGVRAHTWSILPEILAGAERMVDAVGECAGYDSRGAMLESILWSTYWQVWREGLPDDDALRRWLTGVYQMKPPEHIDNDAGTALDRLLRYAVPLHGRAAERYTIGRLLRAFDATTEGHDDMDRKAVRHTLAALGLWVVQEGEHRGCVCVPCKSEVLAQVVGYPTYSKVMRRHPQCVKPTHVVTPTGERSRQCMLFSAGVLDGEPPEEMP